MNQRYRERYAARPGEFREKGRRASRRISDARRAKSNARRVAAYASNTSTLAWCSIATAADAAICKDHVAASDNWQVDHIIPLSKGGEHSYRNVQLAHAFCNQSKGSKVIEPGRAA